MSYPGFGRCLGAVRRHLVRTYSYATYARHMKPRGAPTRVLLATLAILLVATLYIYHPALGFYFYLDDFGLIPRPGAGWSDVPKFFIPRGDSFYRPLSQQVYFFLNYKLFGLSPVGYHAVNIAFHFFNSVLVYLILVRVTGRRVASLLGASFFVGSRAHLVSVFWVSGFTEIGGAFFYLLSFYLVLLFSESKGKSYLALSCVTLVLGLLSKETLVTFPAVAGLYLWLADGREVFERGRVRRVTSALLPHALIVVAYLLFYKLILTPPRGPYALDLSPLTYLETVGKYTKWAFVISADKKDPSDVLGFLLWLRVWLLGVLLAAAALSVIKKASRVQARYYLFGAAWFYITLLPFSFIPRHMYAYYLTIPLVGVCLILAQLFINFSETESVRPYGIYLATGFIALNVVTGKLNHQANEYYAEVKQTQARARAAAKSLEGISVENGQTIFVTPATPEAQKILHGGGLIKVVCGTKDLRVEFWPTGRSIVAPGDYKVLQLNPDGTLVEVKATE